MRIRTKFSLFTVTVVWLTTTVLVVVMLRIYRDSIQQDIQTSRKIQANEWRAVCREAMSTGNSRFMDQYVRIVGAQNDVDYVYFTDPREKVLIHTYTRLIGKPLWAEGKYPALSSQEISLPVWVKNRQVGRAGIAFSSRFHYTSPKDMILITLLQMLIVAGVLAAMNVLAAGLFADYLSRRFWELQQASLEIERGNFNVRIQDRRKDELSALSSAFNHMAQKLSVLDQLKDEFIYTVSHELKSPLSAIIMYAEHLLNNDPDKDRILPQHKEILTTISDNGHRMSMYITNILDVAKIKAGRMNFRKQNVALEPIVRSSVSLYEILARKQRIKVDVLLPESLPSIQADPDHLRQALCNLLGNALKFTSGGGRIVVEGKAADGHVEVSVSDTGIGIPEQLLSRLFQPFVQLGVDEQYRKGIRGTGLGLYIVKQSINAMGGTVSVESKVGEGSRFTIRFPIN